MSLQCRLLQLRIIVQSSEARLDPSVVHTKRETQVLIKVRAFQKVIVCLDDGVQKVGQDNSHEYAPPVLDPPWCAWLRLRIACADGDTIVDGL